MSYDPIRDCYEFGGFLISGEMVRRDGWANTVREIHSANSPRTEITSFLAFQLGRQPTKLEVERYRENHGYFPDD